MRHYVAGGFVVEVWARDMNEILRREERSSE
jgi:hypothetical protein